MLVDEKNVVAAAALFAAAGIALLFFLSETPRKASVAEALVAEQNSLLEISGQAANVTSDKFLLCDRLCISVRSNGIPSALLLSQGRHASVLGRVKEYMGNRYIEAEKIDVE
jgi:hypothetical protein